LFIGSLKEHIYFTEIAINENNSGEVEILPSDIIHVCIYGNCVKDVDLFRTSLSINKGGELIFTTHDIAQPEPLKKGRFCSEIFIPAYFLRAGEYSISIGGHDGNHLRTGQEWIFGRDIASFVILEEFSLQNDFANNGLINLPTSGKKTYL